MREAHTYRRCTVDCSPYCVRESVCVLCSLQVSVVCFSLPERVPRAVCVFPRSDPKIIFLVVVQRALPTQSCTLIVVAAVCVWPSPMKYVVCVCGVTELET